MSVAAVALEHRLNASLLRRWPDQAEGRPPKRLSARSAETESALPPAFVPVSVWARDIRSTEIRVQVHGGNQSITVNWPMSEAAQCAIWLCERLRLSLRRMVTVDDVTAIALFLASSSARNIAAQLIGVHGMSSICE